MAAAAFVCCCPVRVCFFGCIVKFRNGFARNNPVRHFCNSIPEFSAQILELHWGVSLSLFLLCFPVSFLELSFLLKVALTKVAASRTNTQTNNRHTQHTTHNTKKGLHARNPRCPLVSLLSCFPLLQCLASMGPSSAGLHQLRHNHDKPRSTGLLGRCVTLHTQHTNRTKRFMNCVGAPEFFPHTSEKTQTT